MTEEEFDEPNDWLCPCGEYVVDCCHCPECYHEAPWGCDCAIGTAREDEARIPEDADWWLSIPEELL